MRNKRTDGNTSGNSDPSRTDDSLDTAPRTVQEAAPRLTPASRTVDTLLERAAGGLKVFFGIADGWALTPAEQRTLLGDPPRTTFYKWRKGEPGGVGRDTLERLSHVFGIYTALQHLFPTRGAAARFLRQPYQAPPFDGQPVLAWMLHGDVADLYQVRAHLEGVTVAGL